MIGDVIAVEKLKLFPDISFHVVKADPEVVKAVSLLSQKSRLFLEN